jgi:acetolactate synthase-1/3 small subunit
VKAPDASKAKHHIVTVLVENKPGVLSRVAGLFARRGFNIFSLAVAPTEDDRFSRITTVVDVESAPLEQIVKQLDKLVNVVKIDELAPGEAIQRELLMATVSAPPDVRGQVFQLVEAFEGRILAVGWDRISIALEGHPSKLDDFEELLRHYGITALQRTGSVALPVLDRRPDPLTDHQTDPEEAPQGD